MANDNIECVLSNHSGLSSKDITRYFLSTG